MGDITIKIQLQYLDFMVHYTQHSVIYYQDVGSLWQLHSK